MGIHEVIDITTRTVMVSSVVHSLLPPWDAEPFQAFPGFVRYYKLVVYLIGYMGLNARSTVYKSISTDKIGGVNEKR